jgi:hypothetical protein
LFVVLKEMSTRFWIFWAGTGAAKKKNTRGAGLEETWWRFAEDYEDCEGLRGLVGQDASRRFLPSSATFG